MSLGQASAAGRKEDAHTRIYRRLKALAIEYRFRPGEQLLINDIAEHLCVSPTPVRESLIRLQTESLLDRHPRRGFFSKTPNVDEMVQLFEMRFVILRGAIDFWLEGLRDPARDLLTPVIELAGSECQRYRAGSEDEHLADLATDPARYVEAMGERIVAISTNTTMIRVMENTNDRTHYMRSIDLESPARACSAIENIKELADALRHRKGGAALKVLKSDLTEQIARMNLLVKEGIGRSHARPRWYTSLQVAQHRPLPGKPGRPRITPSSA